MSKKQVFFSLTLVLILTAVSVISCVKDVASLPPPDAPLVTQTLCDSLNAKYSTVINPMVVANCAYSGCHDATGFNAPGDLNTYQGLKDIFDNGQLKSRVFTLKDMPSTGPLPDSLLQKLKCWMDDNAPNN